MPDILKQGIALAGKVRASSSEVLARHIGRGDVVQATWLALVSSRPVFFLGPPGVDKTGTVQDLAKRILGAVFFDALMPNIVSPEQLLVESTSIMELPAEGGGREIRTRDQLGRAAEAHLVFADEIWKAEPRVLQALIDLSKGDGVRHEGEMVQTPLMAFLSASNELPDPEGNLGAVWSRMTLRVVVHPLDRAQKLAMVSRRLAGKPQEQATQLTLEDVALLREARGLVEVPSDIVTAVLDILQLLQENESQDFSWAWADDRRFGRIFDILQAHALLQGRGVVGRQDLVVLEWLLWDDPEQIPAVKAALAPYTRTALTDAQELVDALLAPGGAVQLTLDGDRQKGVSAITQVDSACEELKRLKEASSDSVMADAVDLLLTQVELAKLDVIAIVTGQKPQGGN